MYKAFLLVLWLLVSTMMVVAQQRAPQSPPFSPNVQRILDNINAMSPEQRARLRQSTLAWLEERHASEQRAIRMENQNALIPFATMTPSGSLISIIEEVRKNGPLGGNVSYGPLGPISERQSSLQSANDPFNPSNILNIPKGFTPLDGLTKDLDLDLHLEGFEERIKAASDGAIGALNQLQQQIAAFNVLTMPSSKSVVQTLMPPFDRVSRSCLDQIKKDPTIRCVTDDYAYLRSDPKSFFVNTLQYGDYFRVLARHYLKEKCWYYGDAFGSVNQQHVWIECDHLDGLDIHPDPKAAKEPQYHEPGPDQSDSISTREYFESRYGKLLPETSQCNNGFWLAQPRPLDHFESDPQVTMRVNMIEIYGTRDPRTGELTNLRTIVDFRTTDATIRARSITTDGSAATVDVILPGQTIGEALWGFADMNRISLVEPKKGAAGKCR